MGGIELKVMYIFPGQGAQYKGMGSDLFRDYEIVRKTYSIASDKLGYDMAKLSFEDPEGKLEQTRYAQAALFTHSVACRRVFEERSEGKIKPFIVAGHSLGEYSALEAAGAITFEDGLYLVDKRGEFMGKYGKGRMYAFKLDVDTLSSIVGDFNCELAGCNLSDQTIVGGTQDDLRKLAEFITHEYNAAGAEINREAAFHTSLLRTAANKFRPELIKSNINGLRCKVISNYTGNYYLPDAKEIKSLLYYQIFNHVRWVYGMEHATNDGINMVIEFGGGAKSEFTNPLSKKPLLQGVTKKNIKNFGKNVLYQSVINTESLAITLELVNALALADQLEDTSPLLKNGCYPRGTAIDENWFHLYVPLENGIITKKHEDIIRKISKLNLNGAVQIRGQEPIDNSRLVSYVSNGEDSKPQPILEKVIGCETGALLHYLNGDIDMELLDLVERLKHPAHQG